MMMMMVMKNRRAQRYICIQYLRHKLYIHEFVIQYLNKQNEFGYCCMDQGFGGCPQRTTEDIITYLFSVGLEIIDQNKHPDDTDKDNQFNISTHSA